MGIFSNNKSELKTQLHFYDDGSFEFRKRPLKDNCLVEEKEGVVIKAFPHFYAAEKQFDGYLKMPADMVTLSFDRDFILDPFDVIPKDTTINGKPKSKDEVTVKAWLAQIGESQRYKVMNKGGSTLLIEKITMFLGGGLLLMIIGLIITKAAG